MNANAQGAPTTGISPPCGWPTRNSTPNLSRSRLAGTIGCLVLAASLLSACGGSTAGKPPRIGPTSSASPFASTTDASAVQYGAKVDAKVEGYIYSVARSRVSQETTIIVNGQEQDAQPGMKYLVMDLAVTNTSGQREPLAAGFYEQDMPFVYFVVPGADYPAFVSTGLTAQAAQSLCPDPFTDVFRCGFPVRAYTVSVPFGSSIEMAPGSVQEFAVFVGPFATVLPMKDGRVFLRVDSAPGCSANAAICTTEIP